MFKSQGKDPVERELLTRREREKISEVPGKVDSEKIQSTQMERLPLCRKKDISSPVTSRKEENLDLDVERCIHLMVES